MAKQRGLGRIAFLSLLVVVGAAFSVRADAAVNIATCAAASGQKIIGDLSRLCEERLAPEGSPWNASGAVILAEDSAIQYDLGRGREVASILLQADNNDVYFVETSDDQKAWSLLWAVPEAREGQGLRTRVKILGPSLLGRYLRIRASVAARAGDHLFSVSRFHVFSSLPDRWPPALDYSLPNSRPPMFPRIDLRAVGVLKQFLSVVVLFVLAFSALTVRIGESAITRKLRKSLLVFLTALSCAIWPNCLNFHHNSYNHLWEFYHYYIGAKYAREVRYTKLYLCTAVADIEDGLANDVRSRKMRDLVTNVITTTEEAFTHAQHCKSAFTDARWQSFRNDIRWFRDNFRPLYRWDEAQKDHGFNASPVWMIIGSPLAERVPVSTTNLVALSLPDYVFLICGAALVFFCFGLEAACAAITFFTLNATAQFGYTGGAFLRYDWLFWLAAGICALRLNRKGLAGFSLTYSALLRVFPALILCGLALKVLVDVFATRSLKPVRGARSLIVGSLIAMTILVPLSMGVSGRLGVWTDFVANTRKHAVTESTNFMGLGGVLRNGIVPGQDRTSPSNNTSISHTAGGMLFLLLLLRAFRKREDLWLAAILSAGLVSFLLPVSNYYYVFLAMYALLWPAIPAVALALPVYTWLSWLPMGLADSEAVQYSLSSALALTLIVVVTAGAGLTARMRGGCRERDQQRESGTRL